MSKTTFKQADVQRAVRAAKAVGLTVHVVEIVTPDGTTIRVSGEKKCGDEASTESTESSNEWDEALKDHGKRS